MEVIRSLQQRYGVGALSAGAVLGTAAYLAGYPAVARGLVLGSLFSVLNFLLMGNALGRKLLAGSAEGLFLAVATRAGRYLLWAVPPVLAVKLPFLDLTATIAGMFMVPLLIVLASVLSLSRGGKSPPV